MILQIECTANDLQFISDAIQKEKEIQFEDSGVLGTEGEILAIICFSYMKKDKSERRNND